MAPTRRSLGRLAVAGAVALGSLGPFLAPRSLARPADQLAVEHAVDALRQAILDADSHTLPDLVSDKLSYGLWPSGVIQNRFEFLNDIGDKKIIYTSITYSDPTTTIAGNNAIVRHREAAEAHSDKTVWSVEFGVLQIWQK